VTRWPYPQRIKKTSQRFGASSRLLNTIEARKLDRQLKLTTGTLLQEPFDLELWKRIAVERYPDGLPSPFSNDPSQWVFHGHPAAANAPLLVAVARIFGYKWPGEMMDYIQLSDEIRARVHQCSEVDPF
jgi:hypothetical protein